MRIQEKTRKFIKTDSKVSIGTDGLMGNKLISISSGSKTSKTISNGDGIQSMQAIKIDDLLIQLKATADNAVSITSDLAYLINNLKEGKGTIGKLFMDTLFAENLDKTLLNIQKGAGSFDLNMKAASNNILLRKYFKKKTKK